MCINCKELILLIPLWTFSLPWFITSWFLQQLQQPFTPHCHPFLQPHSKLQITPTNRSHTPSGHEVRHTCSCMQRSQDLPHDLPTSFDHQMMSGLLHNLSFLNSLLWIQWDKFSFCCLQATFNLVPPFLCCAPPFWRVWTYQHTCQPFTTDML